MKEGIIPILIVVAIATAIVLYNGKIKTQTDDIDKMESALSGAQKMITPGSHITVQSIPVKNEIHFWSRYVLAPSYVAYRTNNFDTVLTITGNSFCDSMQNALGNRKMLWRNKDQQYCYFLTCAH